MNKYYHILGLTADADKSMVKKRYRQLVLMHHPDRNSSLESALKFQEIRNAYEIIMGKSAIPLRRKEKVVDIKEKERAERIKLGKERFKEQQERETLENERYYKLLNSGWRQKLSFAVRYVGLVVAILLISERFLPLTEEKDRIINYNAGYSKLTNSPKLIITQNGNYIWMERLNNRIAEEFTDIVVYKSGIFHEPVTVLSYSNKDVEQYNPAMSYIYIRWFAVFIFVFPFLCRFYKAKTLYFSVLFIFNNYMVGSVLLYFLLTNDRWLHMFTLGAV